MRNKKILFISILLFMVVLSIGAISAQDTDDAIVSSSNVVVEESHTVSGNVGIFTENPWNTSGELSFDIPSDAKSIESADVYVNVYAGSASNSYGANADVAVTTANNETNIYKESLWTEEGSTDGTVYIVNDHTTKCYSDYMIHYNITSLLDGLNGTTLKINVDTFQMDGKSFDGRIKLIALIIGYDDGDDDQLTYWINDDQLWARDNVTITFATDNMDKALEATLANVVLSSGDGIYKVNGEFIDDVYMHDSGNYYQFNAWDVTDVVEANQKTDLNVIYAGTSAYGSIKNVLSLLMISNIATDISLAPEYTSVPSAYAGTNNTLTVKVTTNNAGNYTVKLFADGVEVDSANVTLDNGENTLYLTDPTIRDIDASTVNGAENKKVNYTAELYSKNHLLNSNQISIPVLYNGNLGYDMEYNITGFENFGYYEITGDFVVDVKDVSSYLGASAMNRTDNWVIDLDDTYNITNAYVYVPYNWFNAKIYNEDIYMFDVTFNGNNVTPKAWYRDQSNLGNYGKYGYGVFVYDVSDLIALGDNEFVLNKLNPTPAVYPSVLVYMYDVPDALSSKTVYIWTGADLLSNASNLAGRVAKSDTEITVDTSKIIDATLYVLAASAQAGESDIIFNGGVFSDVWNGTGSTTNLFTANVTDLIDNTNSISFVATGSTILALPQIIVTSNIAADISLAPEYTSVPSAYAGTNNTLTVTVNTNKAGNYTVKLFADGIEVDSADVVLDEGASAVLMTDPTIRDVDASTVNGAENKKVNYTAELLYNDANVGSGEIILPVLYNGNLGYDMEYNITGFENFGYYEITGDVVIDVKDASSYLGASAMNRTDNWVIDLDDTSEITNAYVYVPYNWFNAKSYPEAINMFNVTFNGATVTPMEWYRDQGNLGNYGKYGYGVFVYDVSDLIALGDNEFVLNKVYPTPAVYPSVLVYMYDDADSLYSRTVYIWTGADLLSNSNNKAGRVAESNTEISVDINDIIDARLYVLAASAQAGESNIVFNDVMYTDVWNGTSSSTSLFAADVTDSVDNNNSISFVATGSTILALPQIIVTSKVTKLPTELTVTNVDTTYKSGKYIIATLTDANGNPVSGAKVGFANNGVKYIETDASGKARYSTDHFEEGSYNVIVAFYGNNFYEASNKATSKVTISKIATKLTVTNMDTTYKSGKYIIATLTDVNGNPISGAKIGFANNGVQYVETDASGKARYSTNHFEEGSYNVKVAFFGDDTYSASDKATSKITISKIATKLTVTSVTTFPNSGKYLIATLTDVNGNPISGAKIGFAYNGVQYVVTDASGKARYSTNHFEEGSYNVKVAFFGDDTYSASDKATSKVTISKIATKLTVTNVETYYTSGKYIIATLTDVNGNPISGVSIGFANNGMKYVVTDASGKARYSTDHFEPGSYDVKVAFFGNDMYMASDRLTSKVVIEFIGPVDR